MLRQRVLGACFRAQNVLPKLVAKCCILFQPFGMIPKSVYIYTVFCPISLLVVNFEVPPFRRRLRGL